MPFSWEVEEFAPGRRQRQAGLYLGTEGRVFPTRQRGAVAPAVAMQRQQGLHLPSPSGTYPLRLGFCQGQGQQQLLKGTAVTHAGMQKEKQAFF